MNIITITNYKGGTGKTSTTLTLASLLALHGKRCLIIDFDPQGQCAVGLGLAQEPGVFNTLVNSTIDIRQWIRPTGRDRLDILPGDRTTATAQIVINAENRPLRSFRTLLSGLEKDYEYLLLDTAPSVGGIQERAMYAADMVLVPTATEFMSSNGLMQILVTLEQMARDGWPGRLLGILPTFYDENTTESRSTLKELRDHFQDAVLSPIHRATILREAPAEGKLVHEMMQQHRAAFEYLSLCEYVMGQSRVQR